MLEVDLPRNVSLTMRLDEQRERHQRASWRKRVALVTQPGRESGKTARSVMLSPAGQ